MAYTVLHGRQTLIQAKQKLQAVHASDFNNFYTSWDQQILIKWQFFSSVDHTGKLHGKR